MADYASIWWRKRYKERQKEREERKNKPKRKWVPPEEYYGERRWENILFFTQGQEAVDKWRREKAEREAKND